MKVKSCPPKTMTSFYWTPFKYNSYIKNDYENIEKNIEKMLSKIQVWHIVAYFLKMPSFSSPEMDKIDSNLYIIFILVVDVKMIPTFFYHLSKNYLGHLLLTAMFNKAMSFLTHTHKSHF